jgi:hypothetical protein
VKVEGWVCIHEDGEVDHNWKWHDDWYGDASIIGGTADCGYWECGQCGEQKDDDPPEPDLELGLWEAIA